MVLVSSLPSRAAQIITHVQETGTIGIAAGFLPIGLA